MTCRIFLCIVCFIALCFTALAAQTRTLPDPAMKGYTPSQIKAVMDFKSEPLLIEGEKKIFRRAADRRDVWIRGMKEALNDREPVRYYRNMRNMVTESLAVRDTAREAKKRLGDASEALSSHFEPFGNNVDNWPPFARAEEEKLRKGAEIIEKMKDIDESLFNYIRFRTGDTYETCFVDPAAFTQNRTYLKIGYDSIKGINEEYRKLMDKLEEADDKAKKEERSRKAKKKKAVLHR